MAMTYRIYMDEHSRDGETYTERVDAETAALEIARDLAESYGDDPETIEIYGGPSHPSWGACPEGSDGAYYPAIEAE